MQYKPVIPSFILCFLLHNIVGAQSVIYSTTARNDINASTEVIGKAGNYYWLYKNKKNIGSAWPTKTDRSFEVYDSRLQLVKEIPTFLSDSVLKQYLIPQKHNFDQLVFKKSINKTSVVVKRFTEHGGGAVRNAHLFDFPGKMALEDLLVTRSPDRTKILLIGFVRTAGVSPDIYARVYTGDWLLLHETIYKEGNLLQPFIQYELTEHVLESTEASPIKINNNGDWMMVAPARLQNSFILCHFNREDSTFIQLDLKQLKSPGIEYCNLSVEEGDAYIGILENITPSDKKVRIMQYSLLENRLGYDTSYSFYVPSTYKKIVQYLFEESFIQIPGKGFMYMKEYGRRYFITYSDEQIMLDNEQEYTAYSTRASKLKFNKDEYINKDLDANKKYERGDLSFRYFPFRSVDSCWGGLLHVEQNTKLRYDNLSYACVTSGDKITFLYNSLAKNVHKVSSTTVLDDKGQLIDEGFIFWRSANVLDFQKARLVNSGELFVPFSKNGYGGFAIIRF